MQRAANQPSLCGKSAVLEANHGSPLTADWKEALSSRVHDSVRLWRWQPSAALLEMKDNYHKHATEVSYLDFSKKWKIKALCESWRAFGGKKEDEQTWGFTEKACKTNTLLNETELIYISVQMLHLCCVFSHFVFPVHRTTNRDKTKVGETHPLCLSIFYSFYTTAPEKNPFKGSFIIYK